MHSSWPAWFVVFALLGLCPLLPAQFITGQDMQSGVNPGGTTVTTPLQIAVSGCLKRGAERNGYYIADKNGTTWQLVPNGVNLAEHLNHNVMITGKPDTNANQQSHNDQNRKTGQDGKPQVSVRVLTVKTLGVSCDQ